MRRFLTWCWFRAVVAVTVGGAVLLPAIARAQALLPDAMGAVTFADYVTTDSYVTVDQPVFAPGFARTAALLCKNGGANSANWSIYGVTADGIVGVPLVTDQPITAGSTGALQGPAPAFVFYVIQAKSTVPGQSTTLQCRGVFK